MNELSPSNSSSHLPCLALLMGDYTGIGPEQVAKVLHDRRMASVARLVLVGDARVLAVGMADANVKVKWTEVKDTASIDWSSDAVPMIDLKNIDPSTIERGTVCAESGRLTGETLEFAIRMATRGEVDGITFAPLNKRALFDGGWKFADEHLMFASLLKHVGYFSEMNVLDGQWMSRVTGHISMREALEEITPARISEAITLADRMMRRAGITNPRIAVAALNPHGGENGLFGREEIEIIRPVVEKMAATGINCIGPFPADTIYLKAFAGDFDSVVSMYHDQGQIATKLKGFNRGVTVTAGLQTIFTTPAHGIAYDIVGKGIATTGALESAIALAARLVWHRSAAETSAAWKAPVL